MAVEEAVDDKIHAPAGVQTLDRRPGHPSGARDMPARTLPTQVEPLLAVDPVCPLVIDAPALAPKQDLNPTISVPNPCLRDLPDPHPQGPVVFPVRTVPMGRTARSRQPRTPAARSPNRPPRDAPPVPVSGLASEFF